MAAGRKTRDQCRWFTPQGEQYYWQRVQQASALWADLAAAARAADIEASGVDIVPCCCHDHWRKTRTGMGVVRRLAVALSTAAGGVSTQSAPMSQTGDRQVDANARLVSCCRRRSCSRSSRA